VLFITHNIGVVEYLCDRVVVLSRGEIVGAARPCRGERRRMPYAAAVQAVPRL
jgi:ABC-type glutathione transport system ATPase component